MTGLAAPVHLSNERERRDGVLQAWVRQFLKTGPQPRRPRLVRDEIWATAGWYRCTVCRGTLSTNTGTAYSGLRCTRREFDQVASLRVEGVSVSAPARVTGHSRNTIARWLERAPTAAKRFNQGMLRDCDILELQADELCTFIGQQEQDPLVVCTHRGVLPFVGG